MLLVQFINRSSKFFLSMNPISDWECIARCAIGGCHFGIIHSQYEAPMGPSYSEPAGGLGPSRLAKVLIAADCCQSVLIAANKC